MFLHVLDGLHPCPSGVVHSSIGHQLYRNEHVAVSLIRRCNPARRVGGGRRNVSGRYPRRKMGAVIQFEGQRVEFPFVYELEHDLQCWNATTNLPCANSSWSGVASIL